MSKIFRLHEGASNNVEDWTSVSHMSEHLIDAIKDPDGGISRKQITSVPTPFAQMDLIRTAFKQVVTLGKPEGLTIYHKLVSDCFDIAEIFFNYEALKDQVEIISWDSGISFQGNEMVINSGSDLGRLLYADVPGHRLLGETLLLFLQQDSHAFNFDKLQRIFLLNYIGKGSGLMNIIGGTSPATLFFSSANDLSRMVDISFGNVKLFGENYTPLFKRDPDFVKYIYTLKSFFPQFASRFADFDEYLELSFQFLPNSVKQDIKQVTATTIREEYQDISIGAAGFYVEILGEYLKTNRPEMEKIERLSDFVIAPTKELKAMKPLVLPNKDFNESLFYVKGSWQANYHAPYFDPRPLEARTLPVHSYIHYPYFTAGDFLESHILRIPYAINKEKYFNGYFDGQSYSFALPIKKEFFRYFSAQDLQTRHADGEKWFELVAKPGNAVEAILRIPIRNNRYIQFSRVYYEHRDQNNRHSDNSGSITDTQFALAVYPFLKTGNATNVHYRVAFIDTDKPADHTQTEYALSFFDEGKMDEEVPVAHAKERSHKKNEDVTSRYYILNKAFDFVELRQNDVLKGLLLPLFKQVPQGATQFSFSVDFGTTNTHIEYRVEKGSPRPFDITAADVQIGTTVADDTATADLLGDWKIGKQIHLLKELLPVDFLPEYIGRECEFSFPVRTVMSSKKGLDINQPTYALADYTIPFAYEKKSAPAHINTTSHLKWSDFKNDPARKRSVEAFIEELLLLIRNKVLLNGGNLDLTKIIWSYPSSMSEFRRNTLESAWHQFTKKYISPSASIYRISESVAPFYYFRNKEGVLAYDKPVVNIDIGGGTSDIVIFRNNEPVCLTSFRFAANSIFGDGYGNSPAVNGFVQKYYPVIRQKLINNELYHLVSVLEQISQHESSEELIAFFFSLENNKVIREGNYPISFSKHLKDDEDFKLVFLMFYASIIYHLAKLMKAKDMEPPRYLLFSGMGSKVINIADSGMALKNLTEYTNLIFAEIYNREAAFIEIKQYEEPKEITCKGGLMCDNFVETDDIKTVLSGTREQHFIPEFPLRYHQLNNRELLLSVTAEAGEFIDSFFSWCDKYYYPKKFGVNPSGLGAQKLMLKEDMMQFLMAGVREKMDEEKDNMDLMVEETLFFYPLKGLLHRMARHIVNMHKVAEQEMI